MDVMLSRILLLIGSKHGAAQELVRAIGCPKNAVTDWKAGRSRSYKEYAPQIADYYGVSLDWLSGLSDDKGIKKEASSEDEAVSMAFPTDLVRLTDKEQRDLYAVFAKALKRMDITPGFAVVRAKVDPSMINRIQKSLLSMASREELLRLARFLECTSEAEPIVRGLAPLEERLAAIYRSYHYAVLAIPIEQIESYSHILQYDENSK